MLWDSGLFECDYESTGVFPATWAVLDCYVCYVRHGLWFELRQYFLLVTVDELFASDHSFTSVQWSMRSNNDRTIHYGFQFVHLTALSGRRDLEKEVPIAKFLDWFQCANCTVLMGSHICCVDWHNNGWPWVILNGRFASRSISAIAELLV